MFNVNIPQSLPNVFTDFGNPDIALSNDIEAWLEKVRETERTKILWCVTAYNESGKALLSSLAGIKQNLDYLVRAGKKSLAQQVTLCLIFDGRQKMSTSALRLLETLDLCHLSEIEPHQGVNLFQSRLKLEQVGRLMSLETSRGLRDNPWLNVYQTAQQDNSLPDGTDSLESVPVLVCIKEENGGKLHSHWWFFQVFSSYLQPDYCIQMDIGSVPKARNVNDLWEFMENNPDVGGAAGIIMTPSARRLWHLIAFWQAGHFLHESFVTKPMEIIMGYLTILPGQFSLMRWKSLVADEPEKYQQSRHFTALDHYFQGLGKSGVFKSNMFLTEDRVLGFGLVTALERSWRLAYVPSVITITEPCESLSELMKQRRRWFNGAFACRLWVTAQTPKYLINKWAKFISKIRLLKSIPISSLRIFNDWFSLPLLIIILSKTSSYITYLLAEASYPTWLGTIALSTGLSLIAFYVITCLFNKFNEFLWFANVVHYLLLNLALIILELWTGNYLFSPIVAIAIFIVSIIAQFNSPWLTKSTIKHYPLFFFLELPITCLIRIYSFFNINDCSWGTKGLKEKKRNPVYKKLYVSFWLLSNSLLLFLAFQFNFSQELLFLGLCDYGVALILGVLMGLGHFVEKHKVLRH